ncbi:hypothetical protein [Luteimicrobium subarcticum]|uniref:Uncharacterized protein n=1 Tax=Luteimicrobium subarcticum TaxID=620910 RepID=A0A2M8WSD2_9MICO|nr:hypothetical protein [Luteimicrobium subarcticum]PJI93794.1 hypothetical protein CLV34_1269 [Luteimicrobium subarcticum]
MTQDVTRAIGRLPFASEVFGTYRPMIGWTSRRKRDRASDGARRGTAAFLEERMAQYASGNTYAGPPEDRSLAREDIGTVLTSRPSSVAPFDGGSFFLPELRDLVVEKLAGAAAPTDAAGWGELLSEEMIRAAYGSEQQGTVRAWRAWSTAVRAADVAAPGETAAARSRRLLDRTYAALDQESRLAGAALDLARNGHGDVLGALLLDRSRGTEELDRRAEAAQRGLADPFTQMDPTHGLAGVSVSPLGIVHYFRQYFFELDSFLGPSVGHVWLTPGSTVELVESSTRLTHVEQTSASSRDSSTTDTRGESTQDDLSGAVKQENRSDTRLGFSATVNEAWPSGDMTATGSMNLDTTQAQAREATYQRMREQTANVSTQLRSTFSTTFKTVTDTTDVSSKRYVLSNPSETVLQNYELRRKMRQVAVQVQDVGTYLCWETFVDDPGATLGLADLVHIAKPPDVTPIPDPEETPTPERKSGISFDVKVAWAKTDDTRPTDPALGGIPLGRRQITVEIPDGYELELTVDQVFQLDCVAARGEGSFDSYQYLAVYRGGRDIDVVLAWGTNGLSWDETVQLDLRGTVALVPTAAKIQEVKDRNTAQLAEVQRKNAAAQHAATRAAFYAAAKERIELAASITKRRFEDLREEERAVVYRNLLTDLMAKDDLTGRQNYVSGLDDSTRHVYATVLEAIFDIDRMLYFVAPEWWKPRAVSRLDVGRSTHPFGPDKVVSWSGGQARPDNYYITGDSQPAALGSSLGWLLQLDGDDLRNRFLNAPWVRAVIPIRPGKEAAALAWLQRAGVEGSDGLDDPYAGTDEAEEITQGLKDAGLEVSDPPTVGDAIRYLCLRIKDKHDESTRERLFPERDGVDDGDKVWATPVDKVYEYGYYPLERSFRADPAELPSDGTSTNFQIMSEWKEVVPTDQVVPVVVEYDAYSGREKTPAPEG